MQEDLGNVYNLQHIYHNLQQRISAKYKFVTPIFPIIADSIED